VERLLMKGRAVEAFSVFEEGVVVERGRADFENAREARDIRDAAKAQERRAKVFAETARLVDVRVNGLMDRLSQQRRHDMLVAEGCVPPTARMPRRYHRGRAPRRAAAAVQRRGRVTARVRGRVLEGTRTRMTWRTRRRRT